MDIWEELYERAKAEYHPEMISPFFEAHHVVSAIESESGEIFTGFCMQNARMRLCLSIFITALSVPIICAMANALLTDALSNEWSIQYKIIRKSLSCAAVRLSELYRQKIRVTVRIISAVFALFRNINVVGSAAGR